MTDLSHNVPIYSVFINKLFKCISVNVYNIISALIQVYNSSKLLLKNLLKLKPSLNNERKYFIPFITTLLYNSFSHIESGSLWRFQLRRRFNFDNLQCALKLFIWNQLVFGYQLYQNGLILLINFCCKKFGLLLYQTIKKKFACFSHWQRKNIFS